MNRPDTPPDMGAQWPLLALVLWMSGVAQLTLGAVSPVLPELATALHVSRGAVGLVHGIVFIPGILMSAYLGYLLDRFGRRPVMRASVVLYGVAGAACFFARDFWLMLGLRLLTGVGAAALLPIGTVIVGDQWSGIRRRWAMGWNIGALVLGSTLWPILAGVIGEGGAFRPFLLYLLAIPTWVMAGRLPEPAQATPFSARPFIHLREALSHLRERRRLSDFMGLLPVSLITLMVVGGLTQTLAPLFLEREFALATTQRGLVIAVGTGASLTASILSGQLGTRVRPAGTISAGLALEVIGFVTIGLASNLWLVALGLALVGVGHGSVQPPLGNFATSAGTSPYRGILVGTYVSANRIGQFGGPVAATALASGIGERQTYLAGAALLAVVGLAWLPLRRSAASRTR